MKYKLSLEKRKKEGALIEDNVPIRITVNHNGQRITLSSGYRTDKTAWDIGAQAVKQGYINKQKEPYNIINSTLAKQKSFLDNYSLRHQLDNAEIDLEDLKNKFAQEFSRKKNIVHLEQAKELSFFELYDLFVQERGKQNDWLPPTFTKFKTLRKHLFEFNSAIHLDKFDEEVLTDFVEYLRNQANMKNTTVKKQLGFLKWFLKWAIEKKHTENTAYQSFKPKLKTADNQVVYLSSSELDTFRSFEIPKSKPSLEQVRDVFLFCCYTSLRYSDVRKLKKHDIKNGKIEIVTQKTTDKLSIKLNQKALKLIEKYNKVQFKDDRALPVISNQRMNDHLKELCELAEINEPITIIDFVGNKRIENTYPKYSLVGTHTGRRTFICNALINGMPAHAVMKITGHSDYKAMQPYIDIVSKDVDNMVDKFIDF